VATAVLCQWPNQFLAHWYYRFGRCCACAQNLYVGRQRATSVFGIAQAVERPGRITLGQASNDVWDMMEAENLTHLTDNVVATLLILFSLTSAVLVGGMTYAFSVSLLSVQEGGWWGYLIGMSFTLLLVLAVTDVIFCVAPA
jgi:hypothetical protein